MTAREIAEALIAGQDVPAIRKQFLNLQAALVHALKKRDSVTARWWLARDRPRGGG
jgi:hypothetical protein